jgi:large subunit ribosomal protein L25
VIVPPVFWREDMANESKLVAKDRTVSGSSAARGLRREGWVPGVLKTSTGESRKVQLNHHEFDLLLQHHASDSMILDLAVGQDAPLKVLLKEVQHDPVTGETLHADFQEISLTEKRTFPVPIEIVGEPEGVTQQGGILDQSLREVEVECLPMDLVEQIELDVSTLQIGDSLLVSDLQVSPALEIVTSGDIAVASVLAPRLEEEEEEAEETEEGAEPEVIGEEKGEGEEGEAEPEKGAAE